MGGGELFDGTRWSLVSGGGGICIVWCMVVVGALAFVVGGWGCSSFSLEASCSLVVGNSSSFGYLSSDSPVL